MRQNILDELKMTIVNTVLSHSSFKERPPVLIDIGASGNLHADWNLVAKYAICIAFDADKRDFDLTGSDNSGFKRLYLINKVVSNSSSPLVDFYLTKSPYCSSTLYPDKEALANWDFASLFDVEKVIELPTIALNDLLKELRINYIDWFKTDSQGTDLSLFTSVNKEIRENILVAEFEPGILDAYINEDKLHEVLRHMEHESHWLSDIVIRGTRRINVAHVEQYLDSQALNQVIKVTKNSPGWGEMTYLNSFISDKLSEREFLLGIAFSVIKEQYAFAVELSLRGQQKFSNSIFTNCLEIITSSLDLSVNRKQFKASFRNRIINLAIRVLSNLRSKP